MCEKKNIDFQKGLICLRKENLKKQLTISV